MQKEKTPFNFEEFKNEGITEMKAHSLPPGEYPF